MSRHTRETTVVNQPPRFSTVAAIDAVETQPRFLHRVLGLAQRAEHAVGHSAQPRPVLFEPLGQPALLVHVTFPPPAPSYL